MKPPPDTPPLSEEDIAAWLQERIAELLEVQPSVVGQHDRFETYGLGSSDAVFLTGDLSELVGRPLSATLAWEFLSIADLAAYLAAVLRGEIELDDDRIDWDLDARFESPHQ